MDGSVDAVKNLGRAYGGTQTTIVSLLAVCTKKVNMTDPIEANGMEKRLA